MDVSAPAPANQPAPAKVPVVTVAYHGKAGQVFRLHIMNLLMNIITLGIYSFWGKTRIRRYMTSHVSISNDRFEYTGTGKELLVGWLKAMVIFLPLLICMSIPGVNILGIFAFLAIFSVALYLALRYRLSRTKWRGIRFRLDGRVKEYFVLSLKRTIINIFTAGFKIPKSDILLWSYVANNMSYGDLKFSYKGDHTRLRKIHLITISIFIVSIVGGFGGFLASGVISGMERVEKARTAQTANVPTAPTEYEEVQPVAQNEFAPKKSEMEAEFVAAAIMLYLGLGIGFISRLWYKAELWKEKFRGLSLGNIRFKSDITGIGLAKLYIVNIAIIIATLGLGKPIAAHRTLRYFATNMRIGGDLKDMVARQEALLQKSGMGDALAADVGFDLGL